MPKTKVTSIDDFRSSFEAYLGKQINFLQWSRYSTEFISTGLPLNASTIRLFAQFKKRCPRKSLSKDALESLKTFQNQHRNKAEWLGSEIEKALRKLNPSIQDWQIYRAFYRAGIGFKLSQAYQQKQVCDVVFYALIYGGKSSDGKSTRSL